MDSGNCKIGSKAMQKLNQKKRKRVVELEKVISDAQAMKADEETKISLSQLAVTITGFDVAGAIKSVESHETRVRRLTTNAQKLTKARRSRATRQADILDLRSWELKRFAANAHSDHDLASKIERAEAKNATPEMRRDIKSALFDILTGCGEKEFVRLMGRIRDTVEPPVSDSDADVMEDLREADRTRFPNGRPVARWPTKASSFVTLSLTRRKHR